MPDYFPPATLVPPAIDGNVSPISIGYNCWTVDPAVAQTNRPAQAGVLYMHSVTPSTAVPNGGTITIEVPVSTAGAGLTYARLALYNYAAGTATATLIGQSADQSTNFTAPVTRQLPVVLSAAISPGDLLYLALLAVGTTGPNLIAAFIGNMTVRAPFRAVLMPSQTILPTTVVMNTTTASTSLFFLGF